METLAYWIGATLGMPKLCRRNRGFLGLAMTRVPAVLRGVLLALPLALPLLAGVTYDQSVRTGELIAGSMLLKSRVPSIDPPVFDIAPDQYAPPLKGARPIGFRIVVEGDRLVQIGKDVSTIFDLKARTLTVVEHRTRSYSVETLDQAEQRIQAGLTVGPNPFLPDKYTADVLKTGRTRQIEGQTAEEYRIVAIGVLQGRRVVGGSSIYWTVPRPPSDELAAFELRWSRECGLPFPGMFPASAGGDNSVFGVMADAGSKLPGYPILYVVESRPLRTDLRTDQRMAAPSRNEVSEGRDAFRDPPGLDMPKIGVRETAFSGFVAGAVDPSVFTVPAGHKEKRNLRYWPDQTTSGLLYP